MATAGDPKSAVDCACGCWGCMATAMDPKSAVLCPWALAGANGALCCAGLAQRGSALQAEQPSHVPGCGSDVRLGGDTHE